MSFESTAIHEAGHGALFLLAEDIFGAPAMISALPEGDRDGFVLPSGDTLTDASPLAVRTYGRMLAAGGVAESLAGFPVEGAIRDALRLARLGRVAKCGSNFTQECADGAEFLLRMHWGAVEKIAEHLRALGALDGAGIELARMALREKPMRKLGLDLDTIVRLAGALEAVPEIAGPFRAACAAWQPAKASASARVTTPARRTWTRPTTAYLDPVPGIETGRRS